LLRSFSPAPLSQRQRGVFAIASAVLPGFLPPKCQPPYFAKISRGNTGFFLSFLPVQTSLAWFMQGRTARWPAFPPPQAIEPHLTKTLPELRRNTPMKSLHTAAGLALMAALGLGAARPAHADLITNGSFENTNNTFMNNGYGAQPLPVASTVIPGWTTTNAPLAWLVNGNAYSLTADTGSYFLDLTGYNDFAPYGGVTQTIATTSGASYHLSFAIGVNQSVPGNGGPVGITANAGNAPAQTFTFNPVGLTGNQWETVGLDFTANSASTPITLVGAQGDRYIGLDSVSVTSNPVPEASTTVSFGLLLALGMGGVIAAKKRKSVKA
jgi:hypothetical protein